MLRSPRRAAPPPPHLLRSRLLTLAACITVREAEPDFVDSTNLEPGERLLMAVKAFDDPGTLLCAGALLSRESEFHGREVRDCWIADSAEKGVGANLQMKGAQHVLDRLFLRHLEEASTKTDTIFNLLVGDGEGMTAGSRAAGLSRGFTLDTT